MNKQNLTMFKKVLMQKKTELLNKTGNSQRMVAALNTNVGDEIDTASQNSEKEIYFEIASNDKITLSAIDDSLVKIEKSTYGCCENCNSVIPIKRLDAIPWTRYCIRCQEEAEGLRR
ncbi:MAG: TraR/DksA family transcriptional regulator [Endomicrobium sp.]|jgi:DnaK suppressor protein|nr:TraR/DksA family transcriptional regulator [Endomicrobium sp.]